ncbi:MAG: hypothetical protein R3B09_29905 [Nannocystaceae bacterium]
MDAVEEGAAREFLGRWRDRGGADEDDRAALAAALASSHAAARAAWPGVEVDARRFAAWLGDRAPLAGAPRAALARLRSDELYLACACARGDPAAHRALEARFLARAPVHLGSLRATPQVIDAVRQELREKLLFAGGGATPKIAQYAGTGPLDGWIRVTAIRTALNLLEAEGRRAARDVGGDDPSELFAVGVDPELDLIKARYRGEFEAAFREALADLEVRDRNLLRFAYAESLTPGRIGAIYNVHRTTAMRWLQAAEAALLAGLRGRLVLRLKVSEAECDSLIAVLRSRLSLTLSGLRQPT